MNLFIAGSILAILASCQPRNPKAPSSNLCAHENTSSTNAQEEDIDLQVYGTNDTTTSWDLDVAIEPISVVADIQEIIEKTIPAAEQSNEVVILESQPLLEEQKQVEQN